MAKKNIGAHPAVSPIPAFMVSCADKEGNSDIIHLLWRNCQRQPPHGVHFRP